MECQIECHLYATSRCSDSISIFFANSFVFFHSVLEIIAHPGPLSLRLSGLVHVVSEVKLAAMEFWHTDIH